MIDLKLLEKLTDLLNRSEMTSIEITSGWWPWRTSVKISKGPQQPTGPVTYQVAPGPAPAPSVPEGDEVPAEPEAPARNLLEIKSPMVGTFYAQPEPGADPYVRLGARISMGQTLCIIEAMKIMNPLDAEITGVVAEVCVEDAQPVEFGQVLFRVDPHG